MHKWILGIVTVVLVAIPIVTHIVIDNYLLAKIKKSNRRFETYSPEIVKDLELVSMNPPFPQGPPVNNAETYLSKYISWIGEGFNPLSSKNHDVMREIFKQYPDWKRDDNQFKQLVSDPRIGQIDSGWMDGLKRFDHWNYASREEIEKILQGATQLDGIRKIGVVAALPLPDFGELRQWAIIYFLKQHRVGKTRQGLEVFRKVAHLSNSSGTLIGSMIAVAMLSDERYFSKHLSLGDWKLVPEETTLAYKRLSWAWVGIVRIPWFEEKFPAQFENYLKPETGVCAGARESVIGLSGYQDFLEPRFPFEEDFSKNFERVRNFQKKLFSICNMKAYEGLNGRTPAGVFGANSDLTQWNQLPYFRRITGLTLLTIAEPNYFRFYE